jgi:eukaryotic-like serine/threonine-protein kinase
MPPSRLPARYQPESSFSGGGMSDTVVCIDGHLERRVVIKALAPAVDAGRILDELAALQEIRSKHVVQIYDVIRDAGGGVEAIVEEHIPGSDVSVIQTPIKADEFISLIYPIAEGIADIHDHNRVHRDIKPTNMKYDAEGILKIFDFGLSRIDGVDAQTLKVIGTRGYMAPELFTPATGGKVLFTKAIDTFAFGSTALMVATGNLPADLRRMPPHLPGRGVDFANLGFSLPNDVETVLGTCFAVNPVNRPTMRSVSDLLAMHLLKDRHRALIVLYATAHELHAGNRVADISSGADGLRVTYDAFVFRLSNIRGNVAINNQPVTAGYEIRGSCVIVLGIGRRITSVTVDVAHPEVS